MGDCGGCQGLVAQVPHHPPSRKPSCTAKADKLHTLLPGLPCSWARDASEILNALMGALEGGEGKDVFLCLSAIFNSQAEWYR